MMKSDLVELWQAAMTRPIHGAGCGCGTLGLISPGPREIELDILDHLEDRYGLHAHPAWNEARRQRDAAPTDSLPDWLETQTALPTLQAVPWPLLFDDLARVLEGIAAHATNRPGWLAPAGSLGRGWLCR